MYDLIDALINHNWIMQGAGDQQYIYYICGAIIPVLVVTFIDLIYRLLRGIMKKGDF